MARPTLLKHRKFLRLCHQLSIPAPYCLGLLEWLWHHAYESGESFLGDVTDVKLAAGWEGDPGELVKALLNCGGEGASGFIEETEQGSGKYQIHDLYEHAPEYVRKRAKREEERKRLKSSERTPSSKRRTMADNVCRTAPNGSTPTPTPTPKKKKIFSSDSNEYRLSELLCDLLKERHESFRPQKDLTQWAKHVDLMLRIDKRTPEEVEQVIRWVVDNDFWSQNILSTQKLRKQYTQLAIQMESRTTKPSKGSETRELKVSL